MFHTHGLGIPESDELPRKGNLIEQKSVHLNTLQQDQDNLITIPIKVIPSDNNTL